jgi:MSHA biogenesis protein MshP
MFHNNRGINFTSTCKPLSIHKNRGSALVIAIFVIIVISLLGAALVKMMASSQENLAFEVLGTRAYTAAQSGAQWQLAQLFPVDQSVRTCASASQVAPIINQVPGLVGCEIKSIECRDFTHADVRYYTIKSIGQCEIDNEKTSRIIEIEARSL